MTQEMTKVAGWAGVLGFVLAAMGTVDVGLVDGVAGLVDFPPTTTPSAEVAAFVGEHRAAILGGMIINTFAVSLWIVFGAGVWLRLRSAAGGDSLLPACFALGLAGFVTLIFAGFVPMFVLAYRAPDVGEARLLYDLTFGMLAISGAPTAVALGAYAVAVLRTRTLPRWTAHLAVLAAVAHVVLLASFVVEEGFFSLQGQVITAIPATLFGWILATGVALLRSGASSASRRSPRPPAASRPRPGRPGS